MSVQQIKLKEIADAIRTKKGTTEPIIANNFATEIINLPSGGGGGGCLIDDFYKEQSQGYYDVQAADIVEARRIWNEVGITEDDVDYNKIGNSVYKTSIKYAPRIKASDSSFLFFGFEGLVTSPLLDTSSHTSTRRMFFECKNLIYVPLLDTSNVTNMSEMFYYCQNLTSIPQLDTSNVTNMLGMFSSCPNLKSIPLLDTSNVTNMSGTFNGCSNLTSILELDTSNVTNMSNMFNSCPNLTSIPLLDTSNVTNMSNMFNSCSVLEQINFTTTRNVTTFQFFFPYGFSTMLNTIKTLDLTSWVGGEYFFKDDSYYQPSAKCHTLEFVPNSIYKTIFFNYCTGLSQESLDSIANGLATITDSQSVTFANIHKPDSSNASKLTEEQVTAMQGKGWTVAFK